MVPAMVCLAKTQEQARMIVSRLREAGFSAKDTSVLLSASKRWYKDAN